VKGSYSLPFIGRLDTLTRQRPDHIRLVGLLIGGYLAVWTMFGLVIFAGDYVLHQTIGHVHWLEENTWLPGVVTFTFTAAFEGGVKHIEQVHIQVEG